MNWNCVFPDTPENSYVCVEALTSIVKVFGGGVLVEIVMFRWGHENGAPVMGLVFFYEEEASMMTQMVKSLAAMQETQVQYEGQESTLEKEMATHSSILA